MSFQETRHTVRLRLKMDEAEVISKMRGIAEPDAPMDWLDAMQDGRDQSHSLVRLKGKTAVFCDIHFGAHDIVALKAAIQTAKREKCINIVLNGDVIDSHRLSRHPQEPDAPRFSEELAITRQFLKGLRNEFPDVRIIFKAGNHEDRLQAYLIRNADAVQELINWPSLLHLEKYGIEFVESGQFMKVGKTFIAHGHEFKVSGGINPARTLLLKTYCDTVIGHVHRTSFSSGRSLDNKFIKCYSIGCLCKLVMNYLPHSNSNHGFAIIDQDGNVKNYLIENGIVLQ